MCQDETLSHRQQISELALCAAIMVASLPARLAWLHINLWLDEAWVANSVMSPSIHGMIYYPVWVQTTPPFLLLLMRTWIGIVGATEITFRAIPWAAALFAVPLVFVAAQKVLPRPWYFIPPALVCANYWGIKYGQQVKQYGVDLFVGALLFLFVVLLREEELHHRWRGAAFLIPLLLGFSFPATWFMPAVFLALRTRRIAFAAACGTALGALYLFFLVPNHSPYLSSLWEDSFFGTHGWSDIPRAFTTTGDLMMPLSASYQRITFGFSALVALGWVAAALGAFKGDRICRTLLLAGPLGIATALGASAVKMYPFLGPSRFVLWALPSCSVFVAFGLERVSRKIPQVFLQRAIPAGALLFVLGSSLFFSGQVEPTEKYGAAVRYVASAWKPGACIFVHGGALEQFKFYRQLTNWQPECVYVGNTTWPCCNRGKEQFASSPFATTLKEDFEIALQRHPSTLWVMMPSGSPAHWAAFLQDKISQLPEVALRHGCIAGSIVQFDLGMVQPFKCP